MEMNISKKWENVLTKVATNMSAVSFDLWLKPLEIVDIKDSSLILGAPSLVSKN